MVTRTITYEDPSLFLEVYQEDLRHNTLTTEWDSPPPPKTPIKLTLHLFPDGSPVHLTGSITTVLNNQVSISLEEMSVSQRAALEQSAQFCNNIVAKMSQPNITANPTAIPLTSTQTTPQEQTTPLEETIPTYDPLSSQAPSYERSSPFLATSNSQDLPAPSTPSSPSYKRNSPFMATSNSQDLPAPLTPSSPSYEHSSPFLATSNSQEQTAPEEPQSSIPSQQSSPFLATSVSQEQTAFSGGPNPRSYERKSPLMATSSQALPASPVPSSPLEERTSPFVATSSPKGSESLEFLLPVEGPSEAARWEASPTATEDESNNPSQQATTWEQPEAFEHATEEPDTDRPPPKPLPEFAPSGGSWVNLSPVDGVYPAVTEKDFSGGSWVSMDEPILDAEESSIGGSWVSMGRYRTSHRKPTEHKKFEPSPEDWSEKELYSAQESLYEQAEIPEPSDWQSSEQSHPHLPLNTSDTLKPVPSNLGYAAPLLTPPPGLPGYRSSMDLPAVEAQTREEKEQNGQLADDRKEQAEPKAPSKSHKEATSPSQTGTLEGTSLMQLLTELNRRKASGYLKICTPSKTLESYLYKGNIMYAKVDPLDESTLLGEVLVQEGIINRQEKNFAIKKAEESELPLGELMYEAETITKRDLASALRRQMQHRLGAFIEETEGDFEYWDQRMPKFRELAPPTSPTKLLFRHRIDWLASQPYEVAQEAEELLMDRFLHPSDVTEEGLLELGLTTEEVFFWENLITGQYRMREVYAGSNFRHRRTYTLMFALEYFKYLSFEKEQRRDWQIVEMREKFQNRFMLLGHETFFELLGVHWSSSKKEIENAYLHIRQEYDIDNYSGEWPEDLHNMSEQILQHLEKVYKHLKNKGDRREYRSGVHDNSKLLFSVDLLEQQGDMAIYRRDFADAIERYSRAIEINPNLPAVVAKLKKSKEAYKKQKEHIKANKGKEIDYTARLRVNAEHLGVRDHKDD